MRVLTTTECQLLSGGSFTLIENYAFDDMTLAFGMFGLISAYGIGVVARSRYNNPKNPPISLTEVAQCTFKTGLQGLFVGLIIDTTCIASHFIIKSTLG